ncbi:H-type lectin domain-containing protein [Brucella intermedia]|uniref:Putative tail fiber protein gp53-like C-terminal domain-containing protein n=1 Tax=Brucella intermedia M86 TaxID=1234597 RepID=M5JU73_9HYPH|nr:H-type lectin domain-containing protein [Brucella intermedia]ELT46821.1 hypothetical protein D584_22581 [Brucella intermedia M86]
MAIRPDYTIGTLTLTSGSANFTTSGSALQTAAVQAGDAIITRSGDILIIAAITGQNSGTLFLPCPASAAGAGQPLRIRFQPDGSRYQGAVRNLIDLLSSGNVEALAGLTGAAGKVPVFTGPGAMDLRDYIADPNGSLGKLAALTLAANKFLTTDGSGNLTQSDITAAALVLLKLAGTAAANKLPYFNAATSAALTDFTAAARALTNLSGTAAANMLPYLTGANGADLTVLSAFARTLLDDTSGAAMWATMGGTSGFSGGTSWTKLPNGWIIQGGATSNSASDWRFAFPTTFPNTCMSVSAINTYDYNGSNSVYIGISTSNVNTEGFDIRCRNISPGVVTNIGSVPVRWLAIGY